jgi:Coenzyme PQQ synthesis protein D (PqqD)
MMPTARKENITIRTVAEETIVYDLEKNKAHCLNPTAAFVWHHCDGQTSVEKLAALVEEKLSVANGEAVVRLALEQLSRRSLLLEAVVPLAGEARHTRREALKKLAAVAAVAAALPLIMTMTAKSSRAAASDPCAASAAAANLAACTGLPNGRGCSRSSCDSNGKLTSNESGECSNSGVCT